MLASRPEPALRHSFCLWKLFTQFKGKSNVYNRRVGEEASPGNPSFQINHQIHHHYSPSRADCWFYEHLSRPRSEKARKSLKDIRLDHHFNDPLPQTATISLCLFSLMDELPHQTLMMNSIATPLMQLHGLAQSGKLHDTQAAYCVTKHC